ncbi:MAG: hypothetical protein R3D67_00695 [Hyphomicrobiaceae bacterium]
MPKSFAFVVFLCCALMGFTSLSSTSSRAGTLPEDPTLIAKIGIAWHKDDTATLESIAAGIREGHQRTADGDWRSLQFYEALKDIFASSNFRKHEEPEDDRVLEHWRAAFPRSPTPVIARALLLLRRSENAKRTVALDRPPTTGWIPEKEKLEEARQLLETNRAMATVDPYWHVAWLTTLDALDSSTDDILIANQEALEARLPALTRHTLPQWDSAEARVTMSAHCSAFTI